jgi:hypothetical protein
MLSTLAGHLPLQDMIQQTIDSAREKIAAAEDKDKKANPFAKHEKGESKAEEKKEEAAKEKKSSAILDISDPEEMDKLASALDEMGDDFIKEADSIENGGESHQGGQQLATMSPVGGKQSYKKDSAHHQVPTSTGLETKKETGSAKTAVPDTQHKPPVPLNAAYPAKGVLKTAEFPPKKDDEEKDKGEKKPFPFAKKEEKGEKKEEPKKEEDKEKKSSAVVALQNALEKVSAEYGKAEKEEHKRIARGAGHVGGALGALKLGLKGATSGNSTVAGRVAKGLGGAALGGLAGEGVGYGLARASNRVDRAIGGEGKKEKKSAVDFIMDKVAEFHGGGETLDSKSGSGPKPPSQPGRQLIANNKAPVSATKREAKAPRKAELAQVLTEPAMTKSTDSKVQDNLRNASKGGVKIAEAAKEALQKIAADPNDPRHEALKQAIAKRKAEKDGGEKKEGEKEEKKS